MSLSALAANALQVLGDSEPLSAGRDAGMNAPEEADLQREPRPPCADSKSMAPQTETPRNTPQTEETAMQDLRPISATASMVTSAGSGRTWNRWSKKDEAALITALKDVGGMDWPQIMSRYGEGGTVNESLKGRNKTNLYNKARSIRSTMEDSGEIVPGYLKSTWAPRRKRARSAQVEDEQDEHDEGMVQRIKRRPRRSTKKKEQGAAESGSEIEEVPTEAKPKPEIVELSDDNGDEINPERLTPKKEAPSPTAFDRALRIKELELRRAEAAEEKFRREIELLTMQQQRDCGQ